MSTNRQSFMIGSDGSSLFVCINGVISGPFSPYVVPAGKRVVFRGCDFSRIEIKGGVNFEARIVAAAGADNKDVHILQAGNAISFSANRAATGWIEDDI